MIAFSPSLRARARSGVSLAALALVVASCGGTDESSTPLKTGGSDGAGTANIVTANGPLGLYLTDSHGKSLYMFASDTATKSSCTGQCLTSWPPLTTVAPPTLDGHPLVGMISTIKLPDGTKQVTFAGHPLYFSVKDDKAGDVGGQDDFEFGGKWWLVTPAGEPIKGDPDGPSAPAA